jgi:hypothetical protein
MRETNSSRVGSDASIAEPRARRESARSPRPSPRRRVGARRRRRTVHGEVRFIGGLLLIVALTAGGFGVDGLIQASRERSRVSSLQAELTSLQQRVASDEQGTASERIEVGKVAGTASGIERSMSRTLGKINWTLQSVPSEAEIGRVRSQLDADAACIGQLQGQLDGLGINWRIDPEKPSSDYFKLSTAAPAPAPCPGA